MTCTLHIGRNARSLRCLFKSHAVAKIENILEKRLEYSSGRCEIDCVAKLWFRGVCAYQKTHDFDIIINSFGTKSLSYLIRSECGWTSPFGFQTYKKGFFMVAPWIDVMQIERDLVSVEISRAWHILRQKQTAYKFFVLNKIIHTSRWQNSLNPLALVW